MPYITFTDEQKILANSVDLEEFLRMRGEKLERVGREHKLIYYDGSGKHDSITLRGSTWFDHKNQVGGGAIKFMQEFYDMDFQTAVQELLGQTITPLSHAPSLPASGFPAFIRRINISLPIRFKSNQRNCSPTNSRARSSNMKSISSMSL